MGLGGISIWQLLIILAIVVMLFGTSRLKNLGSDLGSAIKGFKNSMSEDGKAAGDSKNAADNTQKKEAEDASDETKS